MTVLSDRSSDLFDEPFLEEHDLRASTISGVRRIDDRRYTSGLSNVDDCAGLLRPGEFVVVGAREGQGKTSLVELCTLANSPEHRVLFCSFDMTREMLQDRLLSKLMLVSVDDVNDMRKRNHPDFKRGMEMLEERDPMIWRPRDPSKRGVREITKKAENITAAIVAIDYTRMITGWQSGFEAQRVVNYLVDWAHESMTTTILLSQLRDDAVNKRPTKAHIQDSTQVAQRADRIDLIYRPYNGRPRKDDIAEVITAKNRYGPEVTNHVGWVGATTSFYALDAEAEARARCCYHPKASGA